MHVFLETDRLILRRFSVDDLDLLFYINGGRPISREEIDHGSLARFLQCYVRANRYGFYMAARRLT